MPPQDPDPPQRASWPETIGAWLRVWTPPRDVQLRRVSRRAAALAAAGLVVAAGIVALVVAPAIDRGKRADAQRRQAAAIQAAAQRRARTERDQAARFGRAVAGTRARTPQERRALLRTVEAAITADANARGLAHSRSATCDPHAAREGTVAPEDDSGATVGAYDCITLVREITGQGRPGRLGYPYRAIVDFAARRWAFCKVTQFPGEQVVPDPRTVVALPVACRIPDRTR